jgi:indole-3-glycerol phosphate synthase
VPDFLAEMAARSRERAADTRARTSEASLRSQIEAALPVRPLPAHGFLLIAEVKRISPAQGILTAGEQSAADVASRAAMYAGACASAVSVLTEPSRFGGTLDDLAAASRSATIPVMRKDFLVDPIQILEARACCASGILLIVKMLSDHDLASMLATAAGMGMFTLVEAFDAEDLQRTGAILSTREHQPGTILIGLNTRDLRTLHVDPARLAQLVEKFPPGYPRIAESGLDTPDDIRRIVELGYDGALVGSALMRAADPPALCRAMAEAAQAARGAASGQRSAAP